MRRSLVRLVPIGLAAALAVSACGGDSAKPSGLPATGSTAPSASSPGSSPASTPAELAPAAQIDRAVARSSSVSSSSVAMTGSVGGQAFTMKMVATSKPPLKARISMTMPGLGAMEQIITGNVFYMKMPQMAKSTGKPWVKFDLSKATNALGVNIDDLMQQANQGNTSDGLRMLQQSGDIKRVGTETVRGIETTRYAGTVDLRKALASLPAQQRKVLQKVLNEAGAKQMEIEVWIDGQGLTRRMKQAYDTKQAGRINVAMDVLAYNVPVNVTPPPASQVLDADRYGR